MNPSGTTLSLLLFPTAVAIKVTLVLGLCGIAASGLSRQSAAQRHRVWMAGVLGALILPLLVGLPPLGYSRSLGGAAHWISRVAAAAETVSPGWLAAPNGPAQSSAHLSLARLLLLTWLVIFLLLAARLFAGLIRLRRISLNSTPLSDTDWMGLGSELRESLGVKCPVRILECRNQTFIPVTWGLLRPRIVVPSEARLWSPGRRRIVLAHELAHIARHDWLQQMSAEFMCCIYWFHPLAWIAARNLRQESERACDDAVLNASVPASDYVKELLEIVRALARPAQKWAALAIARPSNLEKRFEALLCTSVNRSPLSRKQSLLVAFAAVCLFIPIATFHMPAEVAVSGAPRGWFLAGNRPQNYLTGIESDAAYLGHASAYLKGKPSATEGFGTLMQSFRAANYIGQRVELSAMMKSEDVSDWAGLWMRVDQGSSAVAFDNMQNRPIKGTNSWQEYSVILDVPRDSTVVSFGVLLSKGGTIWVSNVKITIVGTNVPATGTPLTAIPEGPTNLSFEQN